MTVEERLKSIEKSGVTLSHDNSIDEWYEGAPQDPRDVEYTAHIGNTVSRLVAALREAMRQRDAWNAYSNGCSLNEAEAKVEDDHITAILDGGKGE